MVVGEVASSRAEAGAAGARECLGGTDPATGRWRVGGDDDRRSTGRCSSHTGPLVALATVSARQMLLVCLLLRALARRRSLSGNAVDGCLRRGMVRGETDDAAIKSRRADGSDRQPACCLRILAPNADTRFTTFTKRAATNLLRLPSSVPQERCAD